MAASAPVSVSATASSCASAIRQIPSLTFLLYRRSNLGLALLENLHDFLEMGDISPALAYRILQQFDHSVAKAVAEARTREPSPIYRFSASKYLKKNRESWDCWELRY